MIEENKRLRKRISDLHAENDGLKRQNRELKNELSVKDMIIAKQVIMLSRSGKYENC